jgi:uracil-DNA glycosylase
MDSYLDKLKDRVHQTWFDKLYDTFSSDYFKNLLLYLTKRKENTKIYPAQKDIFKVFSGSLDNVKVVILAQDPYYTPFVADGLAFSSNIYGHIPESLENIFREMDNDLYGTHQKVERNGNLEYLFTQGVFLFNTALTVEIGKPESHLKLWERFTQNVLETLNNNNNPTVFMLWGNKAKRYERYLTNPNHLVLTSGHPSPLSANKGYWFGNKHFSTANEFLTKHYGKEKQIKWDCSCI